MKTALVLGAGGFIGSHLVNRLKSEGYWVRGVDLKYPEFSPTQADDFILGNLCDSKFVSVVMFAPSQASMMKAGFDEVYQLAADMGGAGYVFTGEHDADIMHNSATINLNVLDSAVFLGIGKIFYSSSACMYPQELQQEIKNKVTDVLDSDLYALKESDAYPGNPDSEYGWEKLFSERLYLAYARNYGLNIRIARFHNIYGPEGTYKGGREKAPAAMCRKAIEAEKAFSIWGDGQQTRSFLYIDDCIDAVRLLMQSDFREPINIGSEEMVPIRHLAQTAIEFSGKNLYIDYEPNAKAIGVRGRNSDNTLIEKVLGWKPKYSLRQGMGITFSWIREQYENTNS